MSQPRYTRKLLRRSGAFDCIKAETSVHWLVNFSQLATAPAARSSTAIVEVALEPGIVAVLKACVKSSQIVLHTHMPIRTLRHAHDRN